MKIEIKDLEKAIDRAKKDGAVIVDIDLEFIEGQNRFAIKYQTELSGKDEVRITLSAYESGGFNKIRYSERF